MSVTTARSFINLPVFTGGVALLIAGFGLYLFSSPSPHGFIEIFFALPIFCAGLAFTGAAFLLGPSARLRSIRLFIGWALVLLATSPLLYLAWLFIR